MIVTQGVIVVLQYAVGGRVGPGEVVVVAESVGAAQNEVIAMAAGKPGYNQEPIAIISTDVIRTV
jgi:hypothetical protein